MSNSRLLKPEERVFVVYKNNPPARVIAVEKRGRKHYLLLRWENVGNETFKPEKWVKDSLCTEVEKKVYPSKIQKPVNSLGTAELNWFQKLIVKLQNWWYGIRN